MRRDNVSLQYHDRGQTGDEDVLETICAEVRQRDHMKDTCADGYRKERVTIPGVFSAAGLMVPEPSVMSGLIPFIELETGCDVEYIMAN